jgi:uncharacterized protein (DUF58 family)
MTSHRSRTRGTTSTRLRFARRPVKIIGAADKADRPRGVVVSRVLEPVTTLGWSVLGTAMLCWLLGWGFGWAELLLAAAGAGVLFCLCIALAIGRMTLRVQVRLDPRRVVVGEPAAGEVHVTSLTRRPMLPLALELPVGSDAARFQLPLLRPNVTHEELFVVPTQRRGVIPIGPARTVRGDPLGLIRRQVTWTDLIELIVRPVTVPLDSLGSGLLRDLEGLTTNDLSMSDLAFHALRDYLPGDDRRYIHWRSSAKTGHFMVRQFLDTRRSHITLLVDSAPTAYPDAEDYELAVSAAASIVMRALTDEQEITVLAGRYAIPAGSGSQALDTFARVELDGHGLDDLTARSLRMAPDTSIALLVTGSSTTFIELRRAASQFPQEVAIHALRIDPHRATAVTSIRTLTVLTLQKLSDLNLLLHGGVQ